MSRFVPRRSIGRLADEVADIHARIIEERRLVSPLSDVQPEVGRDVTTPIAITQLLSRPGGAAQDLISPPAPEAIDLEQEIPQYHPELAPVAPVEVQPTLSEVEDLRRFQFGSVKPLRRLAGTPTRLRTANPVRGSLALPAGVAVEVKADTILCLRRKARRGTLLALGQGGGYHRKPRRSPTSDIWC